jgi:hypothetical protein
MVERFLGAPEEADEQPPGDSPHAAILANLVGAHRIVRGSVHTGETTPLADAAQRAIKDAFFALCRIDGVPPEMGRWARRDDADLELAQAMLEQDRSADFSEVLRHIEAAHVATRKLAAVVRHLDTVDARSYVFLRGALESARVLLNTTPPKDHPWDVQGTLANLIEATAAIDRAKLDPDQKLRREPRRGSAVGIEGVPYFLRVHIARNLIARELREVEALRDKGPREALAPTRAALAAIEEVLARGAAKPRVSGQAAAQRQ